MNRGELEEGARTVPLGNMTGLVNECEKCKEVNKFPLFWNKELKQWWCKKCYQKKEIR